MAGDFGRWVACRVREEISDALEARVPAEDADSIENASASRYLWIVMRFEFESESAMGREVRRRWTVFASVLRRQCTLVTRRGC